MAAEILAGLGALKTAFDLAKGLKDINDAATRNAAVIDLQERILAAQQAQSELVSHLQDLEKEVTAFEAWNVEKGRYQLKDFGGNTFAYELKPENAHGDPPHRICPNCYEKRQRAILQFKFVNSNKQDHYQCSGCGSEFDFGYRHPSQPIRVSRG
jgi:hypothetical protein